MVILSLRCLMTYTKSKRAAARRREMQAHHEWARRVWESAFTEDWDYEYLLIHLRAKLVTMERYNTHLSYVVNGPYYGAQIRRAIRMIDIILDEGGSKDYDRWDDYSADPASFRHYVNMRNRSRIPRRGYHYFSSEAQQLRFDKAWMLLWKILSEQMMDWGD